MKNKILRILGQIKHLDVNDPATALPCKAYYLDDDLIYCQNRSDGDSRFPISIDGLTLWGHASGYIEINESNFFLVPPALEGKQPFLAMFGGVKKIDKFISTSITGVFDPSDSLTHVVFDKSCIYYIKEIKDVIFATRLTVNKDKSILISNIAINMKNEKQEVFLSTYLNAIMTHGAYESEESKWFKRLDLTSYGAKFTSYEDLSRELHLTNYGVIKTACNTKSCYHNVSSSRADFTGGVNNNVIQSPILKDGNYNHAPKKSCQFAETSAYSDVSVKSLHPNEFLQVDYKINLAFDEQTLKQIEEQPFKYLDNDKAFLELENEKPYEKDFDIYFSKLNDYALSNELWNKFLKSVQKQVDYSAKAKNSSLQLLGIRDIYQMLEASLMWNPSKAREIILKTLDYIDISGRCPRQISIANSKEDPLMDNREFIDQGQWIISTIYKYLSFTNDFSILNEKVKYIQLLGRNSAHKLDKSDTVYEHLITIMNYLISHIDNDSGCLCTLYGDWNDAVDGLGTSSDPNKEFGNGVSSMATFHLYKNLLEMEELVRVYKDDDLLSNRYKDIANEVLNAANRHLIVKNGDEKRIIHGWGENKSFYVGSFDDVDHKSRNSCTSNAFYVISNMYQSNKDMKPYILKAYDTLDSKYGLRTFDEFFDRDAWQVGRIINLPKGTAENAATYIHASMFGVKSLFMMDEPNRGFDQIFKLIPITHGSLSHSPFVMPNSYVYNPELGCDGQSMNDWYTGSSNTLLKLLVSDVFGVNLDLGSNLTLNMTNFFPCDEASLVLFAKGKYLHINYHNNNIGKRNIQINGNSITSNIIDLNQYKESELRIDVID